LPWDQLAFWAITVGTNIASAVPFVGDSIRELLLGGTIIGQSTLIRFYVLHCFFLPAILLGIAFWHMWRVRKDGGLAVMEQYHQSAKNSAMVEPVKTKSYSLMGIAKGTSVHVHNSTILNEENSVASSPNLIRRIWTVFLITFVITSILALAFPAPLEEAANPLVTPNPAKAPWYFLWLQEIVTDTTIHIGDFVINGALIGGVIIPSLVLLGLIIWPWLDKSGPEAVGVWFASSRRKHNIIFLILVLVIIIFTIIGTVMRGPNWNFYWPWEAWPEMPTKI